MKMLTLALSCLALSSAFADAPKKAVCIQKLVCEQSCTDALTLTFYFDNGGGQPGDKVQVANPKVNCQNACEAKHPGNPQCPGYQLVVVPPSTICKVTTKSRQTQKKTSH